MTEPKRGDTRFSCSPGAQADQPPPTLTAVSLSSDRDPLVGLRAKTPPGVKGPGSPRQLPDTAPAAVPPSLLHPEDLVSSPSTAPGQGIPRERAAQPKWHLCKHLPACRSEPSAPLQFFSTCTSWVTQRMHRRPKLEGDQALILLPPHLSHRHCPLPPQPLSLLPPGHSR